MSQPAHELHGALIGIGTAIGSKVFFNRPWEESLGWGAAVGAVATGYMKAYGHPKIISELIKQ